VAIPPRIAYLCLKAQAAIPARTMGPDGQHAQTVSHEVRDRSTVAAFGFGIGSIPSAPGDIVYIIP